MRSNEMAFHFAANNVLHIVVISSLVCQQAAAFQYWQHGIPGCFEFRATYRCEFLLQPGDSTHRAKRGQRNDRSGSAQEEQHSGRGYYRRLQL
jgi:hypothetical protein